MTSGLKDSVDIVISAINYNIIFIYFNLVVLDFFTSTKFDNWSISYFTDSYIYYKFIKGVGGVILLNYIYVLTCMTPDFINIKLNIYFGQLVG